MNYVTKWVGFKITEFKGCGIEKCENGCRQVENNQPTDVAGEEWAGTERRIPCSSF